MSGNIYSWRPKNSDGTNLGVTLHNVPENSRTDVKRVYIAKTRSYGIMRTPLGPQSPAAKLFSSLFSPAHSKTRISCYKCYKKPESPSPRSRYRPGNKFDLRKSVSVSIGSSMKNNSVYCYILRQRQREKYDPSSSHRCVIEIVMRRNYGRWHFLSSRTTFRPATWKYSG